MTRPKFNIIGNNPSWIIQRMAANTDFNGARPTTPTVAADDLDPVVTGGQALWSGLDNGGLFYLGGNRSRPCVVEAIRSANATFTTTLVKISDPSVVTRSYPSAYPFKLGVDECIKVTSTGAGLTPAEVGFFVRLEGTKIV